MSSDSNNDHAINVDLVRALHNKVKDLESEVTELQSRVEELESGGASSSDVAIDPYDQAVLKTLQSDQIVTTPQLANRYIAETKIMDKKKAKRRAKALRNGPRFESEGYGEYRYVGGDGDE